MTTVALLVRIEAKANKAEEVARFLEGALPVVGEEAGTTAWYAIRLGPTTFGIYDAFPHEAARKAHLGGKVAAALFAKAPELLAQPPQVEQVDVLASKLTPEGVRKGLVVRLEAKPEKAQAVASFLRGGQSIVVDEVGTKSWFAIQMGPTTFGIFDAFPDDDARKAHLDGRIPAALMPRVDELLARPPVIEPVDVLAAKLPPGRESVDGGAGEPRRSRRAAAAQAMRSPVVVSSPSRDGDRRFAGRRGASARRIPRGGPPGARVLRPPGPGAARRRDRRGARPRARGRSVPGRRVRVR